MDIENSNDIISFHYGDKIYKKIFQIEELTELEKEKNRQLEVIIADFYQKVCPDLKKRYELKDLRLGYIEGYGYCEICFQERGYYQLKLFYENFEEMCKSVICSLAFSIHWNYYSHNYVKINKISEKRFSERSDNNLLLSYEYVLKLLLKYFDNNIPKKIIEDYQNVINYRDDYFYEYNLEVKKFIKKKKGV